VIGIHKIWHPNGKIDGEYFEYHNNGKEYKICTYDNDKLVGMYEEWSYDGTYKKYYYYDDELVNTFQKTDSHE
jgi:antitoxin component YwqK of YwqJK toxin-antitoxin module